jgi:hypothetical protein
MGGPGASILVRKLEAVDVDALESALLGCCSVVMGKRRKWPVSITSAEGFGIDWRGEGRPFSVYVYPAAEYVSEVELNWIAETVGWWPAERIEIAAHCNDEIDYVLLGKLCSTVARAVDGLVQLGSHHPVEAFSGPEILHVPFESWGGATAVDTYCVATYLDALLVRGFRFQK